MGSPWLAHRDRRHFPSLGEPIPVLAKDVNDYTSTDPRVYACMCHVYTLHFVCVCVSRERG